MNGVIHYMQKMFKIIIVNNRSTDDGEEDRHDKVLDVIVGNHGSQENNERFHTETDLMRRRIRCNDLHKEGDQIGATGGISTRKHKRYCRTENDTAEDRAEQSVFCRVRESLCEDGKICRTVNEKRTYQNTDNTLNSGFRAVKDHKESNKRNVDQNDHGTGRSAEQNVKCCRNTARTANEDRAGHEKHIIGNGKKQTTYREIHNIGQDLTGFGS